MLQGFECSFGSRFTRYRRLGFSCSCWTISSVVFRTPTFGRYFLPPAASISFRTATSHEFISSGLSKTSRKLDTDRLESPRKTNFEKIDLEVIVTPSSLAACRIWSTQRLPGITSLAKAAEVLPSCRIFSGSLSKLPSPAYCSKKPDVAST